MTEATEPFDHRAELAVCKLGGSLLDQPHVQARLNRWLARSAGTREARQARWLWVVGGGRRVDHIRALDRQQAIGDREAHWRAIDQMAATGRQLQRWFPAWPLLESLDQWQAWIQSNPGDHRSSGIAHAIVRPDRWLRCDDRQLPASWDVTSDSIAAAIAIQVGATRLTLLKSCPPPGESKDSWVQHGWVDRHFQQLPLSNIVVDWHVPD